MSCCIPTGAAPPAVAVQLAPLVAGQDTEGLVLVQSLTSNAWGTVCAYDFGPLEARAVCSSVGLK